MVHDERVSSLYSYKHMETLGTSTAVRPSLPGRQARATTVAQRPKLRGKVKIGEAERNKKTEHKSSTVR